jgi:molybdate transport system substrate-binding protein
MARACLALLIATFAIIAHAEPLRIAVAANFQDTFNALVRAYADQSDEQIEASYGPTGILYTQIVNGAPFVALFAADDRRTAQLVAEGRARPASRFAYAIGRLALWTPVAPTIPPSQWLADDQHRVAIANPELAPYGLAAQQTLTAMHLWDRIQPRLVTGNSVAQTLQFVATGGVPGGFVALAQLIGHFGGVPPAAQVWLVPQNLHAPIVQEAVVLETPAAGRALAFFAFVASDAGRALIEAGGYSVPASTR